MHELVNFLTRKCPKTDNTVQCLLTGIHNKEIDTDHTLQQPTQKTVKHVYDKISKIKKNYSLSVKINIAKCLNQK